MMWAAPRRGSTADGKRDGRRRHAAAAQRCFRASWPRAWGVGGVRAGRVAARSDALASPLPPPTPQPVECAPERTSPNPRTARARRESDCVLVCSFDPFLHLSLSFCPVLSSRLFYHSAARAPPLLFSPCLHRLFLSALPSRALSSARPSARPPFLTSSLLGRAPAFASILPSIHPPSSYRALVSSCGLCLHSLYSLGVPCGQTRRSEWEKCVGVCTRPLTKLISARPAM